MSNILYTTPQAIRAAVGTTTKEIPDSMLKDQGLESQMRVAVYSWLPTHAAIYAAGTAGAATEAEIYQKDLLVNYCLFYGAIRVVEMIMALRKKVGDGKSQVERFDVDWEALLEVLRARMEVAKNLLEEIVNPGDGGTAYFGVATPDYDPVTNL